MAVTLKDNALITEVELEEMLQQAFDTDFANTLINVASDRIDAFCNRQFRSAVYTREVYDGNGLKDLYLKNFPITDLGALELWDTYNDALSSTYTVNTDYLFYATEGFIRMRGRFPVGSQNMRVTYTAGYAIADVPYDIKMACAQLCAFYNTKKTSAGLKSESLGDYSYTMADGTSVFLTYGMPAEIARVLMQYRSKNI